jgi:hypothetical protein
MSVNIMPAVPTVSNELILFIDEALAGSCGEMFVLVRSIL